jgi:hypothetical protein
MRLLALFVLCFLAGAGPVRADSGLVEIIALIKRQASAIATADATTFKADWIDGGSIVDGFPPYLWIGPGFQDGWMRDFAKGVATAGLTNFRVSVKKAQQISIAGDTAYAVVPTSVTWDDKGKHGREHGTWTIVLKHSGAGWKILAWAWGGPPPKFR